MLWSAVTPAFALADTAPVTRYTERLQTARQALVSARGTTAGPTRATFITSARQAIQLTDAVTLPSGGTIAIDDSPLLDRLDSTDAGIDATIARLDARIALLSRVGQPAIDPARSDAALRDAVGTTVRGNGVPVLDLIAQIVLRFLSGLRGPQLSFEWIWTAVGLIGIAVIVFIVATLGRGLPERVRREVLAGASLRDARPDPAAHLRAADDALASGRAREAIHALFLYVLSALAEREVIRYDPSFTDRELLVATAAIPHADALRELIGVYERSWFGVREPSDAEARRVRELALRVAP